MIVIVGKTVPSYWKLALANSAIVLLLAVVISMEMIKRLYQECPLSKISKIL